MTCIIQIPVWGDFEGPDQIRYMKYNTGDEMLDCIVRMKVTKMEEEGIEFLFDGAVDGGLGMKAVDVCSIFANAFDNAIEACERLPETAEKWVKLIIKRTDKFFSITLSNTMSEDENEISVLRLLGEGGRVTSKKEKSLHGFGTENMRNAIRKYDGIQKIDINEGVFTLSVMIPRKMMAEK